MARYIDADRFKSNLEKAMEKMHVIGGVKAVGMDAVIEALNRQPTADVAEVCRCKDCKYSREEDSDMYGCTLYRDMRKGSDFCNYGERKAQE